MSSSILSNNNCGPVTGLLNNQTFLLHTQTPQKTISPPPLWRTFYAPPPTPTQPTQISNILISNDQQQQQQNQAERGSPIITTTTATKTLQFQNHNNNNNNFINVNLPNQRMTLQKLPSSNAATAAAAPQAAAAALAEQTQTQGDATSRNNNNNTLQKSTIMSVSKLVRPTPKTQQQHLHHQHQHLNLHQHYINDIQTGPINLVTTTNSNSNSNSSTTEHHQQSQQTTRSRPSSNSSVDIESDDIPAASMQPPLSHQQQQHSPNLAAAAAFQFNYNHLYANKPPGGSYQNHAALHAPYTSYAAMAAAAAIAASTPNNNLYPINAAALSHHHHHLQQSLALAPPPPSSALPVSTATGTIVVPSNISPNSLEQHHHHHHRQHQHQHQHHQHLQDQQKSRLSSSNDHLFSPPLSTAVPPTSNNSLANGTYLNCKTSPASDSTDSQTTENYFKVPNVSSGKEGSLKHRILTRPALQNEKEEKAPKSAVISTNNSTANFKKGSYIELANGVLRRVEDMRTEDFIQCAERSLHLQLAESTVVRIDTTKPQVVIITFSYDRNRSKAEIEVAVDHPFFVYGQGWASCDPEKSHKAFGLKCQRLQVGDICISLTQRTTPPVVAIKTEASAKEESLRYLKTEMQPSTTPIEQQQQPLTMAIKNELQNVMPPPPPTAANLPPAVAVAAAYSTRPPPTHFMSCLPPPPPPPPSHHQLPYPDFAELVAAAYNNSAAHLHHMQTAMPPPPTPEAINGFYQQTQQLYLQGKVTAADLRLQPPLVVSTQVPRNALLPPPLSLPPSHQQQQHLSPILLEHMQDQPFDASIASRKRRWSAPEGAECDQNGSGGGAPEQVATKLYKAAMAPVTT